MYFGLSCDQFRGLDLKSAREIRKTPRKPSLSVAMKARANNRVVHIFIIAIFTLAPIMHVDTYSRASKPGASDFGKGYSKTDKSAIQGKAIEGNSFPQAEWEHLISKIVTEGLDNFEKDLDKALAELNQTLSTEFSRLRQAVEHQGDQFARQQLNRRTIAELGHRMAMDRMFSGYRFETWMNDNFLNELESVFQNYAENVSLAIANFERAVEVAMHKFDSYTHQRMQEEVKRLPQSQAAAQLQAEISQQMRARARVGNLQLGVAIITLPIDGLAIAKAFPVLRVAIIHVLKRTLAPLAAKIAGTVVAAKASSWAVPLAVTFGVGGAALSTYEICKLPERTRNNFLRELQRTLDRQADTLNREVLLASEQYVQNLKKQYRKAAPEITKDLQK